MANAVIGALRVVLGADTAALDKGLSDSSSKLAAFGSSIAKVGAAAGAAIVAAGVSIGMAVKGAIDDADKLSKMSQKIGVPIEELSGLRYAADLADVSMEALGKSVGKLSKAMVEAAAKPTSEAANAFKALGVSVVDSDGKLKSSTQVMGDIAGKFEGLKDGAGKTAVAMAIFGKAGAEMIPLLNAGKTGLEALTSEAQSFGIVISKETGKAAEEFNDNLKRMSVIKNALYVQIAAQLLPTLQKLSELWVQNAKDGTFARDAAEAIGGSMLKLTEIGMTVSLMWKRLGAEWNALKEFLATDIFSGKLMENWQKFNEVGKQSERMFAELHARFENDPMGKTSDAIAALAANSDKAAKSQKDFNFAALGGKNAVDQYIESTKKSLAAQEAEATTVGMLAGAKERLRIVMQGFQIAQTNSIPITDAMRMQLSMLAFQAEQTALKIAGLQLQQSVMTPAEQFQQTLINQKAMLDAGAISAETYGRANQMAAERAGVTWDMAGASMAGSFQQIAQSFGKESSGMAKAAQVFGGIQATISMFTGAAKALELPFPANLAAMAAVLAKGASLVASIKGQSVPGNVMGGAFRVPGGVGGGDKVLTQMALEPGELVEVSSNRAGGYRSGGGGSREIVARGFKLTDLLTGAQVVDLLNDALADGHRVRLA